MENSVTIHIQNYRNYSDFTMNFHKGLNVIIGSNNSGKTGLLYAINLLYSPSSISVDDFNKNNLLKYNELYIENAPEIVIEYYISHRIAEDDTNDESIIRLLPFLGIKEFEENRTEKDGKVEYNIAAKIKAVFSLDVKYLDDYKKELKSVTNFDEYFMMLNRFVEKHYSWSKDFYLSSKGLENISMKGDEFYFVSLQSHHDIAYIYPCKNFELDENLKK